MASKKTAIKPDFFAHFESLKRKAVAQKAGVSEEELALYHMSQSEGWQHFNKEVSRLLEEMDALNDAAITTSVTLEDIGRNTMVISLAKGIIKRLVNKVLDAKEVCERQPEGDK